MIELVPDEWVDDDRGGRSPRRDRRADRERVAGLVDHLGLVNNRNPDPGHFADIVHALGNDPAS